MSYRIVYLLISTLLGIQLNFAADGTQFVEKETTITPSSPAVSASIVRTDESAKSPSDTKSLLIEILFKERKVQARVLYYLDLRTLLTLSEVSRDLYTLTETVFEHTCDKHGFIQWSGKSQKLRFMGNLHYKRAFGMYPHEDRRVYYTRPAEPPYVPDMRLARKLVDAGFPKGAEILQVKAHVERMLALERSSKGLTQYNPSMEGLSSYSFLRRRFRYQ